MTNTSLCGVSHPLSLGLLQAISALLLHGLEGNAGFSLEFAWAVGLVRDLAEGG
jgi:hypothetical protein